jgi:MFS family permease
VEQGQAQIPTQAPAPTQEQAKEQAQAPAQAPSQAGFGAILRKAPKKVYAFVGLHFVFMVCLAAYFVNSSVYIINVYKLGTSADAGLVGFTYTFVAVLTAMSYRIWGRLFTKWIVPLGYALVAVGFFIILSITTTLYGVWIAAMFFGMGMNLANPYISSEIMSLVGPDVTPVFLSLFMGGTNLAIFLSPFIMSFTSGFFGGGIVGALRSASIVLPLCSIAALFLYTFGKKPARQ